MSPSEIRGLLDERFRLLTGRRRRAVERHQTLRATVDWSYSLLDARERAVFDRLGVFAGTFDAAAAQAVVTGDGVEAWDVLDALTELVAKSMIVAEETTDGTTRYQMLETLGQYARERLDERGATDHWRRHHAEYFAEWAEDAGPGLLGPDELAGRTRENAELDNFRAAVTWALDRDNQDDLGLALRVIGALAHETIANPAAGIAAWAERALRHVETTTPQLRYAVTAAAARHHNNLGSYDHTREIALSAIGDGVPLGAPAAADAHGTLAITTLMLGEPETARAIALDAARRLDRESPGSPAALFAHSVVSVLTSALGDPIARPEAELVLRHAREAANPTLLAGALYAYGFARVTDDPAAALAALDESIALGRRGASPTMVAIALIDSADLRARSGDLCQAARDLREGVERSHQAGTRTGFYSGVWWGVGNLIRFDHLEQAAVFDGIASTVLTPEYRASAGTADWTHLSSRHRIGTHRLRTRPVRRRVPDRRADDLRRSRRTHPPSPRRRDQPSRRHRHDLSRDLRRRLRFFFQRASPGTAPDRGEPPQNPCLLTLSFHCAQARDSCRECLIDLVVAASWSWGV
jgi:hypothetical protein